MTKKFEKIVLTTCIETYGEMHSDTTTALDEIIPAIEKFAHGVTVLDYDIEGEYELVKKPGKE